MTGSQSWVAPAVGAGAAGVAAILGIVVNLATDVPPDWWWLHDGRVLWPAVGVLVGVVVWLGWMAARLASQADDERSRALELMLIGDGDRTRLSVLNKDRYEVTNVRIECWLLEEPGSGPQQPILSRSSDQRVSYSTIAGGGQLIQVTDLLPLPNPDTGEGPYLGSWILRPGAPNRIEFTVDWLDHQRHGRRLVGVADLKDFPVIGSVDLAPPEPFTSPPSRWGRLKRTLSSLLRQPST